MISNEVFLIEIRWICVDDDLPEDGKQVLVCGFSYDGKKDVGFSSFERSSGWRLPSNFCQIYFWAECEIHIPAFDIKDEHNLWENPVNHLGSTKDDMEKEIEKYKREIGGEILDVLVKKYNVVE